MAADVNILFASLVLIVLVPLYAIQTMGRLFAQRERTRWLDPLTSLANRAMLQERFDHLVLTCESGSAERSTNRLVLVLLNLDRFKYINDSFGHHVGDRLLNAIATRLAGVDTVAASPLGSAVTSSYYSLVCRTLERPTILPIRPQRHYASQSS